MEGKKQSYLRQEAFEEEAYPSPLKKWRKWIFLAALLVIILVIMRWRAQSILINNVDLMVAAAASFLVHSKSFVMYMKVKSPQLITNPFHASFGGRVHSFGPWVAIKLGGYNYGPFQEEGNEGTYIFPKQAIIKAGGNLLAASSARIITPDEVPVRIIDDLVQRGFPKPFYIGLADESLLRRVPEFTFMLQELLETNELNAKLKRNLKELMDLLEDKRGFYDRAFGRSIMDKVRGMEER